MILSYADYLNEKYKIMNEKKIIRIRYIYHVGKEVYVRLKGVEQHQLARSFVSESEAEIFAEKKSEEIKTKYFNQYYDFDKGGNQWT